MSDVTARLDLPLIKPSQAQKHVTHNEALQVLDGLVQAALEETDATTPPFEPVAGTLFALGTSATEDWSDQDGKLAFRVGEGWIFIDPEQGWQAFDKSTGSFKFYDGTDWVGFSQNTQNLSGVGIGTSSDSFNRLSVSSDATLFSHSGAGHQLKVNKSGSGDTASLLFQSGFNGHAEMGLAGDNAFSVKVTDDGSTWFDAMRASAATQTLEIGLPITGNAVQQSAVDASSGRLLKVGAFGLGGAGSLPTETDIDNVGYTGFFRCNNQTEMPAPHQFTVLNVIRDTPTSRAIQIAWDHSNGHEYRRLRDLNNSWAEWELEYNQGTVLGVVSQSGGKPSGALIESGDNANGQYLRFADGTQICTHQADFTFDDANTLSYTWTYPAAFSAVHGTSVTCSSNGSDFVGGLSGSSIGGTGFGTGASPLVAIYKPYGHPDFTSGQALNNVRIMAMGRWI